MRRTLALAATVSLPPAFALSAALVLINRPLSVADALVLALVMWALMAVLSGALLGAVTLVSAGRRYPRSRRDLVSCAAAATFVGVWFPQLLLTRRLVGFGVRMAAEGTLAWALLISGALAVMWACGARRGMLRRAVFGGVAAAAASAALSLYQLAVEPSPSRMVFARALAGSRRAVAGLPDPRRPVLVFAADGMDWAITADLVGQGLLPHIASVITGGLAYELDNRQMALSPQIWSAIYTGTGGSEPIGGFVRWRFRGVAKPIAVLPSRRGRAVAMLDNILDDAESIGPWRVEPTRSDQLVHGPLWRIASAADRRVLVVDPFPFDSLPESLHGVWVGEGETGLSAWRNGQRVLVDDAGARADIAARMLAQERPDITVYYTQAIDLAAHDVWSKDATKADQRADARHTHVTDAYRGVDAELGRLMAAAPRSMVVIVSDHGWELSAYEHRTSANGVLVFAGVGTAGYAGVADVSAVAATILALADVPIPAYMADGLPIVQGPVRRCACDAPPPIFVAVSNDRDQRERAERLRAVGYLAR